ncbi:TPA: hypothetical protein ACH3X3_000872 [Trebouxia sp. C0006]
MAAPEQPASATSGSPAELHQLPPLVPRRLSHTSNAVNFDAVNATISRHNNADAAVAAAGPAMEGDPRDGDRLKDVGSEEEVQLRPQGNDEGPGGGSPHEDSNGQDADGHLPQRVRRQGPLVGASRPVAQRRQPPRLAKNKGSSGEGQLGEGAGCRRVEHKRARPVAQGKAQQQEGARRPKPRRREAELLMDSFAEGLSDGRPRGQGQRRQPQGKALCAPAPSRQGHTALASQDATCTTTHAAVAHGHGGQAAAAIAIDASEPDDANKPIPVEDFLIPKRLIRSHSDQRLASYQRRGWNQDVELCVEAIVAEKDSRQRSRVYLIKWKGFELDPVGWERASKYSDYAVLDHWLCVGRAEFFRNNPTRA